MHTTVIKLKNGETHAGNLHMFCPCESYISIGEWDEQDRLKYNKYDIRDMESAVTLGERISISKIGDQDEIQRAREWLADGRKYGWEGTPKEKFTWE